MLPAPTTLPRSPHECPPHALSALVVAMLGRLVAHNDRILVDPLALTRFHSRAPPAISVADYVARIVRYANIEPAVLLMLLVYIDRICARFPAFTISSLTAHRFIITAVVVGSKSISDQYCTNAYYAKVGGISLSEINVLELEFCQMMRWELCCSDDIIQAYYRSLVRTNDTLRVRLASDTSSRTSRSSLSTASGSPSNSSPSISDASMSAFVNDPSQLAAGHLPAVGHSPATNGHSAADQPQPVAAIIYNPNGPPPLPPQHAVSHTPVNTSTSMRHMHADSSQPPSEAHAAQATLSPSPSSAVPKPNGPTHLTSSFVHKDATSHQI